MRALAVMTTLPLGRSSDHPLAPSCFQRKGKRQKNRDFVPYPTKGFALGNPKTIWGCPVPVSPTRRTETPEARDQPRTQLP